MWKDQPFLRLQLMNALFALLIFFSACSSTSKQPYISKKTYLNDEVIIDRTGVQPFLISDCAVAVIVIPVNPLIDFEQEVENKCGKDWEVFDLNQKETMFTIPILYRQYCRTVSGSCKKN